MKSGRPGDTAGDNKRLSDETVFMNHPLSDDSVGFPLRSHVKDRDSIYKGNGDDVEGSHAVKIGEFEVSQALIHDYGIERTRALLGDSIARQRLGWCDIIDEDEGTNSRLSAEVQIFTDHLPTDSEIDDLHSGEMTEPHILDKCVRPSWDYLYSHTSTHHAKQSFSMEALVAATDNFSSSQSVPSFGRNAYAARLDSVGMVLLKVYTTGCDYKEGKRRHSLRNVRQHNHLIKCVGSCVDDASVVLVYDYQHHITLADRLRSGISFHDWRDIALGVGQAIIHLTQSAAPLVPSHFSAKHILLRDDFMLVEFTAPLEKRPMPSAIQCY